MTFYQIGWFSSISLLHGLMHGLRKPREEKAFTAWPKIQSQSQIFRYGRSIFCLPHRPKFSDFFDLCLHWVSVVRAMNSGVTKPFRRIFIVIDFQESQKLNSRPVYCSQLYGIYDSYHALRTPNEGINQRNLKIWANVTNKICLVPKNLRVGVDFRPCSEGDFLTGHP